MRIKLRVFLGSLLLIIVCFLSGMILFDTKPPTSTQSSSLGQTAVNQPPGLPAIEPRTLSSAVGSPRFTVSDVRAYLSKSKQPYIEAPTVSGKRPTIRSIEFITSKEATIRMHGESTGLPDSALVCYVEFFGPFDMSKVVVPSHSKPMPTMKFAVEIFDAQTGNLLMSWAHP